LNSFLLSGKQKKNRQKYIIAEGRYIYMREKKAETIFLIILEKKIAIAV